MHPIHPRKIKLVPDLTIPPSSKLLQRPSKLRIWTDQWKCWIITVCKCEALPCVGFRGSTIWSTGSLFRFFFRFFLGSFQWNQPVIHSYPILFFELLPCRCDLISKTDLLMCDIRLCVCEGGDSGEWEILVGEWEWEWINVSNFRSLTTSLKLSNFLICWQVPEIPFLSACLLLACLER